ncbi:ATP-binding protein [Akkermansiaceae bacterium]|nr:ATP-binding protein [Akkermansiaceae bacterium]MDA7888908.1 ATP-binding protein [Akkermansiaceae bacterium]MDB4538117.1 ATP-binding protein [Akkermansiaceae bacterium]
MKSIRARLTAWFLASLGVLWLGAGAGVYFSYRAGLIAGMEAELQTMCRQVRSAGGMGGGPAWSRTDTTEVLGPDILWQTWNSDGEELSRSENLEVDLPLSHEGRAEIVTLSNGIRLMSVGHRFGGVHGPGDRGGPGRGGRGMGGFGGGMDVTVARPLDQLDLKLRNMALAILGSGVVLAGLAWWWVRFVLRKGLSSLGRIAEEISGIDDTSLGGRFGTKDLPSELQPVVERLNQLMDRLEAGFARERRFSSDLAHEMRTPIAEAKTIAESSLKWPDDADPEVWRDVLASVERMEGVVQSMLQLARLEREAPDENSEPFSLALLVDELWADHAALAEARGVTLRSEVASDAVASGDRAWWNHLLGNLLGNAAEYADADSEIIVSSHEKSGVRISNQASGLEPDDVNHLFDRFWRADEARGESVHCGLGLSLAKACAEALALRLQASLDDEKILHLEILSQ